MKQVLFILLSFFAQQTICAEKSAAQKSTDTPATATPKHSPQQSVSLQASSDSDQLDTNGMSDKIKALFAQAGKLILRSPAKKSDDDKKDGK